MKIFSWSLFFCCISISICAQTLRIATYQYADNNRVGNLQPFASHLKEKYSIDATVKSYPTVHALIEGIQKGQVDIALINTFGYLLLETSETAYPMEAVLALQTRIDAVDNYKTAIVVSSKSRIDKLADIGKLSAETRLMLVARGSTSGNLVPRLAFSKEGIAVAEKNFKSVHYAGTHRAAVESILNGQADMAAMGHTEYEKFIQKDSMSETIKLVWLSPEIPLGPVLLNKNLEPATRAAIIKSFLELHEKDVKVMESLKAGWSEAKQASHFIHLPAKYYNTFLKTLGNETDARGILLEFVN